MDRFLAKLLQNSFMASGSPKWLLSILQCITDEGEREREREREMLTVVSVWCIVES